MLRTETESCPNISIGVMDCQKLAPIVTHKDENVLLIDGRSFLEYNMCHIRGAVNVSCSKIMKRRLQQNKISINELLLNTCGIDLKRCPNVIIYDQESLEYECLPEDSFIS
ncbi:Dual specificity protein phosphatase 8-like protein, partial [Leptotrombidium deliense]